MTFISRPWWTWQWASKGLKRKTSKCSTLSKEYWFDERKNDGSRFRPHSQQQPQEIKRGKHWIIFTHIINNGALANFKNCNVSAHWPTGMKVCINHLLQFALQSVSSVVWAVWIWVVSEVIITLKFIAIAASCETELSH